METIRDSAFGKLVRFVTNARLLRYPEEVDNNTCQQCRREQPQATDEESAPPPLESEGEDKTWGLYSVMSQASRVTRRNSWQSTLDTRQSCTRPGTMSGGNVIIVDWRGPSDSENPQNWSTMKKLLCSCQIWLLTFAIYIGSAIYTPGIPGVSEQFGVSSMVAVLGLTLFVLGYGLGPMIWSPLSELPNIGRNPVYILTLVIFVFFQFSVIYAKNIGMLLAFRFLTGFIGSPCLATGAASISNIWNPKARDYMIGIWGCFAVSAPVLGPLVGGFAAPVKGWAWTIWQLLWVSAFTLVVLFFFLPETYAPNILCRRARRIRRITGDSNYMSESEIELRQLDPKVVLFEALVRPFQLCFLEPVVFLMNLYISIIYRILYIWFEAFPIVFGEIHGFNPGEVGLSFLRILKYQSKHYNKNWNMQPEYQLPPAFPIITSMLFAIGGCFVFNSIFTYLAHAYLKYAASALAGNDFMRSSVRAGFPLFTTAMFDNLGVGWACTLLGCCRIRLASKYARHDI
ncbi:major facilitator superfamily domain-containing protein [Aspergillus pseudoustus]|uniref:Major facilitator superfamily domain-containing protein n=1 Tax=Aspergillus pseudoustus TaxID=1810923 RepID=A0ABR4KL38_9EURO